jgi:predicted O-methyltransferase YrrM
MLISCCTPVVALTAGDTVDRALRRVRFAARVAARDPRLLADYAMLWVSARRGLAERSLRPPLGNGVATQDATRLLEREFGSVVRGPAYDVATLTAAAALGRVGRWASMAGDLSLGELAYAITRALRPDTVVETGVAVGLTSAYVLAALTDNRHGELHSVDLPPPQMVAEELVGAAVPAELRGRWRYHWGSARRLLAGVLRDTAGGRRCFIHDSDHRYRNVRWELETAWRALAPGDVIVCDDAHLHAGFTDTARAVGAHPRLIRQRDREGVTGLMVRA